MFDNLPDGVASQVLMASGQFRGVFDRPLVGDGVMHPYSTGFRLDSHRIVWVKRCPGSVMLFLAPFVTLRPILLICLFAFAFVSGAVPIFRRSVDV